MLVRLLLCLGLLCAVVNTYASAPSKEEGDEKGGGEYMEIKPALITNYGGPGPIHFLKAEVTLRISKEPEANELVMRHMPRIRHELIMLFSRQAEENLSTMQGKEQLRQDALAAIQKLLESEEHKKLVEDLLFTNFVVQR